MADKSQFDSQPYGESQTRRLTIKSAEDMLFKPVGVGNAGIVMLVDYMGGDDSIIRAATGGLGLSRVDGNPSPLDFFTYLLSVGKERPFSFPQIKFHFEMPISKAFLFVPDRRACANEYSLRYSEAVDLFRVPGSPESDFAQIPLSEKQDIRGAVVEALRAHNGRDWRRYLSLLENGLSRELARSVIGQGLQTRFYWKMDLLSILDFIEKARRRESLDRMGIEGYIEALSGIVRAVAPEAFAAYSRVECSHQFSRNNLVLSKYDPEELFPSGAPYGVSITKRVTIPGLEDKMFEKTSVFDGFVQTADYMGSDQSIADAARISYGKGTRSVSDNISLIRALKRDDHGTPFHMIELCVETMLPFFCLRQLIRHRTARTCSVMDNYEPLGRHYFPDRTQIMRQSISNKQGRDGLLDEKAALEIGRILSEAGTDDRLLIEDFMRIGVPWEIIKEGVGSNAYIGWTISQDGRNISDFLKLRQDSHAQYEVRNIADVIAMLLKQQALVVYQAHVDYVQRAVVLSRMEQNLIAPLLSKNVASDLSLLGDHPGNPSKDAPQEWFARYNQEWWNDYKGRIDAQRTKQPDGLVALLNGCDWLKVAIYKPTMLNYMRLAREAEGFISKLNSMRL